MTVPHDEQHAETLAGGIASIDVEGDDTAGNVRIVPLGEGDITRGASGKKTYWDRETLREGVDSGAFDGAKLLKGRAGDGHKDMLEQADPDEIVGTAGEFEYEDDVGPVSESGEVLDNHLEKLVEAGLVEVSPDMWRVLGEFDEDLGAYRVEEILDVPYITILDRGASDGATIEPAETGGEAFAADPSLERWAGRAGELAEALGVPPESVADIALEGLARAADGSEVQASDERAESRAESGTQTSGSFGGDGSTDGTSHNMADPEELQEQLAEVRSERDDLEGENEAVREQLAAADESFDEDNDPAAAVADLVKDKEQLSNRVDDLEDEVEPLAEMLAELAAEDSPLTAEQLADRFKPSELVETLALDAGWSEDDDEDPVDIVREQLSGSPSPRGEADDPGGSGGLSDDERAEAEQLAGEVMNASDRIEQEAGESNREMLMRKYDVDPSEYDDVDQLRREIRDGIEA